MNTSMAANAIPVWTTTYMRAAHAYGRIANTALPGYSTAAVGLPSRGIPAFSRVPRRASARIPLLLYPPMQRVIRVAAVAIAELAIVEENRGVTGEERRPEASRNEDDMRN